MDDFKIYMANLIYLPLILCIGVLVSWHFCVDILLLTQACRAWNKTPHFLCTLPNWVTFSIFLFLAVASPFCLFSGFEILWHFLLEVFPDLFITPFPAQCPALFSFLALRTWLYIDVIIGWLLCCLPHPREANLYEGQSFVLFFTVFPGPSIILGT